MGYSYDNNGRLCCDICDSSGGVRKHRCPFGWCQSIALCPSCRSGEGKKYLTKEYHRGRDCEKWEKHYQQKTLESHRLYNEGKFLRTAAMGHGKRVKVLFQNIRKEIRAYWMSHQVYDAIPLVDNATIEDYRKFGKIRPAKSVNLCEDI